MLSLQKLLGAHPPVGDHPGGVFQCSHRAFRSGYCSDLYRLGKKTPAATKAEKTPIAAERRLPWQLRAISELAAGIIKASPIGLISDQTSSRIHTLGLSAASAMPEARITAPVKKMRSSPNRSASLPATRHMEAITSEGRVMAACPKSTRVLNPLTIEPVATGIIELSRVMFKIPTDTADRTAQWG